MKNTVLKKINKTYEKMGEKYLVLANGNQMITLNEIAFYMWQNCDGKTVDELATYIYEQIINKEEVTIGQIENDCKNVIEAIRNAGLVQVMD